MHKQFKKFSPELARLVDDHEQERNRRCEFPEKISPRNALLFDGLTLKQKGCFILHFFMTRKEIALLYGVSINTVKDHLRKGMEQMPRHQVIRLKRIKRRSPPSLSVPD